MRRSARCSGAARAATTRCLCSPSRSLSHETAGAEVLRNTVLLILALVVCFGALLALIGLLARRPVLFHTSALVCAIGYLVYGLLQVVGGALQLGSAIVVVAGLIYVVLGSLAYAMYRSV